MILIILFLWINKDKYTITKEGFKNFTDNFGSKFESLEKPVELIQTIRSPLDGLPKISINLEDGFSNQFSKVLSEYIQMDFADPDSSLNNLDKVNQGKIDFTIAQEDLFQDVVLGEKKMNNLRFVSGLYYESFILLAHQESNINSWKDLKNKIVGFPDKGSGSFYNGFRIAQAAGLNPGKDFQYINVNSMNRLSNLFLNKELDAIYLTTNNKNPYLVNLSKKMALKIIGTKDIDDQIMRVYFPYDQPKYINTNYFYTNINTSTFIKTYATRSVIVSNKNFDAEYIYNLTKTIFKYSEKLKITMDQYLYQRDKLNFVLDSFLPTDMAYLGFNLEYHPGSSRYYYEYNYISDNPEDCSQYVGQNTFKCPTKSI